ncbi:hypothetical protein A9958_04645 [Staphylococcus simulans]|uniref:helix-turn-helix domain-containing protein n=2 Tax=Staphylococcus simulans TaxID=1286 RepID=UPI000D0A5C9F|nr:helix-turn-helix transcriptional regulator [Staphylococcus simulans]AVO01732.1 hypothetical protein BI282_04645 [Staphylococcus simulans]AVO04684.1 hypothetical protein BI283_04640 [Staphylococcus simulans]AWG18280.1 hypothetical protein A9958_04645 [Staphylococcus simulans]AWI01249.1 hypothetical protein A7X73_04645 [Staphylococcus simulans]RIN78581.1 XRE family transcriptional regulator [Staphylococcus simulans]
MNEFGEKLKELRGKKSIREASRGIGISHTYLDSLEKGFDPRTGKERKPTVEVIYKLSQYYNVDFFDLSRLAGVFVSIKNAPNEIKREEIKKIKKKFQNYFNENEIKIKNDYLNIMTDELSYHEVYFWQHILEFYYQEKNNNIHIEGEGDVNIYVFIGSLFKLLNENKNSGDEEVYEDILNDISKFLKNYLNIK